MAKEKARVIYSCITLKNEIEKTIAAGGFSGEVHFLSPRLHSDPREMHRVLQQHIDENTTAEEIIIFVSGCGRATTDLVATTADLVLPRTMDCLDILLSGSGIERPEGAIFVTAGWMRFMQESTICHERLIAEKGRAAAADMLRKIYRGFTDFYIIETDAYDSAPVLAYIEPLVAILDGQIKTIQGKYAVLKKIIQGGGETDRDIIRIKKGGRLDIREFDGLKPATIK